MEASANSSKIERLLAGQFSGNTEKMFNALKSQLKKEAVKKEDCSLEGGTNRGIYLRAFIKGLNGIKRAREESSDLIESDNLYSFPTNENDSAGRAVEPLGASMHVGGTSSVRLSSFPMPSISSVARHLIDFTEVKVIRSKHLKILQLDLQGMYSRKEIARMVGCSEPTITNVISSEAVQQFKRRAQSQMEDEYSSLFQPAISAIRESLHPDFADLPLRQDTAFKYLKTQGRGVQGSHIEHNHRHTVTGKNGGPIEVSDVKQKMLQKLGYSLDKIVEADFKEVPSD